MFTFIPVIVLSCETCSGTGEIDDRYEIWKHTGQLLKQARIARKETLFAFCKRTGEDVSTRSRMERGLILTVDKYNELGVSEVMVRNTPYVDPDEYKRSDN
jgi:hypothetical protein